MVEPLDFLEHADGSLRIATLRVAGGWLATEVYRPECRAPLQPEPAVRFCAAKGLHYRKLVAAVPDKVARVSQTEVRAVLKAREAYRRHRSLLAGVWGDLARCIEDAGVPAAEIGIFGSLLAGLEPSRDVDFVVYGEANRDRIKEGMGDLHRRCRTTPASSATVARRVAKGLRHYHPRNSLEAILGDPWATIEVGGGIHTTLHFVKPLDLPADRCGPGLEEACVRGTIREAHGFDFMPQTCALQREDGSVLRVNSTLWLYHAGLRDGWRVRLRGVLNAAENVLHLLDRSRHFIEVEAT